MNPINSSDISPAELEARLRLHRLPELGPKLFSRIDPSLWLRFQGPECSRQRLAFPRFARHQCRGPT